MSRQFFHFFLILIFRWLSGGRRDKRVKNSPKWQNILSVVLHISGTIYQIIWLSFMLHICKMIIKGQKATQNDKNFCLSHSISHELKVQKMTQNDKKFCLLHSLSQELYIRNLKLPISVCFALYLRNSRLNHQDFHIDIYRCFSLFF